MSESGARPADTSPEDASAQPAPTPAEPQSSWSRPAPTAESGQAVPEQPSPEQPYDVPASAQQYGQPPVTAHQPPTTDGQSAPVQGPGPHQYGQPEHGQASYVQEGFPAPDQGQAPPPYGAQPYPQGPSAQQPYPGQPAYGQPQAPYVQQQPWGGAPQQQPYAQPQQPWGQAQQPYGQPQQPYPGQPPYGHPQQPYGQPYAQPRQPYGQQPYAPSQQSYPGQGWAPQPAAGQTDATGGDQRLWATLTNISIPFLGFIGPLVAYLVLRTRSPFLKDATTEALNFSILYSVVYVVGLVLPDGIGGIVLAVGGIAALVLCILAAVAANKGEVYRYPVSWRPVK